MPEVSAALEVPMGTVRGCHQAQRKLGGRLRVTRRTFARARARTPEYALKRGWPVLDGFQVIASGWADLTGSRCEPGGISMGLVRRATKSLATR